MELGEWLKGLGLGQYEATFRAHELDTDVLPDLTEADLEKIGLPLGARKRLLKGIAGLASAAFPPPAAVPNSPPGPSAAARVDEIDFAERRPITVLFCDLVGSTSLAARLDAEDWRNLVNAYLDAASKAVASFGGHVLKRLGDGLMALFGYPRAQENDAERAVRAALAIQRALADLNARNAAKGGPDLKARIGVDFGPAVVEANGEVFGDAPNVAARVEGAAQPGTVLVTLNVQRQVAGLFVAEDEGARDLKGVAAPVQLFRIVRASGGGRRGGARALTPFVGREDELAMLARRWERAQAGERQLVTIVGEPGLGKSRLVEEFHARLKETPHTWVEWRASQLMQNTPLHPLAEWGRARFGADAPAEDRFADLESTLRLIGLDPAENAPLLAPLVDIPPPPGRAVDFPPEELRRKQLAALTAWTLAGARSQPIALTFEDLHWADPTSLDLLRALAERGAPAPLLILATARPEFRPPWSLRPHHSVVSLSPLDRAGVARMVGEISARHVLSREVIEGVSERTGGVPLFVEEVTRLLLERGEERGAQAIPPTLQQSLAARLDRLGNAREIAQIAAVLGREFSYGLLRDVASMAAPADDGGGLAELALQAALDRLVEADLLFVEGAAPQATYRFKHALIQDAAYDSLLRSRRQALHRRAAELLRDDPERASAAPEVIAHHFTEAGLDDPAIEWWGKAGDQALRRSAFQEAIAHLGKAIAMADKGGGATAARAPKDDAANQRLKLQIDYGSALSLAKGYAAEETKVAHARAAELAATTGDFFSRSVALGNQFSAAATRGELRLAREAASTLLSEAEDGKRIWETGVANAWLGIVAFWEGHFPAARMYYERALHALDPNPDPRIWELVGDYKCWASSYFASVLWQLGEIERARETIDWATRRAADVDNVSAIGHTLYAKSYLELWRGDPLATLGAAQALRRVAQEHGMLQFLNEADLHSGWARGRIDDPRGGGDEMRRVLSAFVEQNVRVNLGLYTGMLAELEAETLGAESALARIDEAFALSNQAGHRCSLPFLHRLRGNILVKHDPAKPAPAEEAFRTAIAIANSQSGRSQALQASLSLAKLYQLTARPVDAHAVLAPALEGFAPTPEMPEIAEAQAILAALAETEEVKAEGARRERRLKLQTDYAQALMWSKGFAARETQAAFARADKLAVLARSSQERERVYHAQWAKSVMTGQLTLARNTAEEFLREVRSQNRPIEAVVALRALGLTCIFQGDIALARRHIERALAECAPEWNIESHRLFGTDSQILLTSYAALTAWLLGDAERARRLIGHAVQAACESDHVATMTETYFFATMLEAWREEPAATEHAAEIALEFARAHGVELFATLAEVFLGWSRGCLRDPEQGARELQQALATYAGQGNKVFSPHFQGLVAELDAMVGDVDEALASVDSGLALAHETGERWSDPLLFRRKGEILLQRDAANPAPAEEAFRIAIDIARQQGSRSFGLAASLSLARLYHSTGRLAEAHAVLAPTLEGFSPTPEIPKIAEAQALLTALAETER